MKFTGLIKVGIAILLASGSANALMSVEDFVRLSDFGAVDLSPDGQHLAATVPVDGKDYMIVLDISDPEKPKTVYQMKPANQESVSDVRWISDNRLLFSTVKKLGTLARPFSRGRIYAIDKNGRNGALLVGAGASSSGFSLDSVIDDMPEDPRKIKVITFARDRGPVAEIIDTFSARRDVVDTGPFDNGDIVADKDGNLRFAVGFDEEKFESYYAYRPDTEGEWVTFENPFEGDVSPLAISRDATSVLVGTNAEGNFGIIRMNLKTLEYEQVISHAKVPINSIMRGRDNDEVIGAEFLPGLPETQFLSDEGEDTLLWKRLLASFPDAHVRMSRFTRDGKTALVTVISDRQPPRFFLLDVESFSARYLFDTRPQVKAEEMRPRESFWIKARDGGNIQLYVTRPAEGHEKPMPTVMVIHGGPHGPRDTWSYDAEAQLLASRGYTVIQPNYRGSGGFGKQFERSGYKKWGREMQDDITDVTHWAFEQGIADSNKTCIYGGSYGGYATLAGITREPDLYACAFAFVGVYDLPMMKVRGDIPDSEGGRTFLDLALGTDKADLEDRSPANHVDRIITPLYVAHGKADKRVPVQQFYNLKKKLDKAGIAYEELLVSREGHGFYALDNRVRYYRELLAFLEKHIGENAPGKAATTAQLSDADASEEHVAAAH